MTCISVLHNFFCAKESHLSLYANERVLVNAFEHLVEDSFNVEYQRQRNYSYCKNSKLHYEEECTIFYVNMKKS